jgi:hypothetical protein
MEYEKLHKNLTGISAEFLVAGELARRNCNVSLSFGNTKSIDLFVEKGGRLIAIQVKGIQRLKSVGWNISLEKIKKFNKEKNYHKIIYVLVNLHADNLSAPPEYFIMTSKEVETHFKPTRTGRDYLDYNFAKRLNFQNKWNKI